MDELLKLLKSLPAPAGYTGNLGAVMGTLAPDPGTKTLDLSETQQVRDFRAACQNAAIEDNVMHQFAEILSLVVKTYLPALGV
ncbi:MAG: hypothetical protein NTU93_07945 [Arthrobacter sp.]|nr:hypothetical protein [Arthrobacter sp.]